jgi:hypothetical protein
MNDRQYVYIRIEKEQKNEGGKWHGRERQAVICFYILSI